MEAHTVAEAFAALPDKRDPDDYNFAHFRTKHVWNDAVRTVKRHGLSPGAQAPDFSLPRAGGGSLTLSELRGRPVLLHFGSYTWPATLGSVEPLKKLHARWGDRVQFVDVVVRQAHPGPRVPRYQSFDEKLREAERYRQEEGIPWPVLVDELAGNVHQVYGCLADPTYLLDVEGQVAYYNIWTSAPTLHRAIKALLAQGGRGVVADGVERTPHILPALTDGWRGLRRGLPTSYLDLELAAPGSATGVFLGSRARGLLAPLALRARPLPMEAKVGLAIGTGLALLLAARLANRR